MTWDDAVDEVITGDLTAALGYRTPAGGVVVQAVAPIGLRDRAAGRVGFTTSLGFSKKLERIARDQRICMAFHTREHGTAQGTRYVLVQGNATVIENPSDAERARVQTHASRYLGPARTGRFWDYWLSEYYRARVPVWIDVDRVVTWPALDCAGLPVVSGEPLPEAPPNPQAAPRNGTGPRVDVARAAKRLSGTAHTMLGFAGADGRPLVLPVAVAAADPSGLSLSAAWPPPPGGRRAGLLGHSYRPQLIGLRTRQYTGWLTVGADGAMRYAPHTETGYVAPPNKTLLLLLNGALAKRGTRAAARRRSAPPRATRRSRPRHDAEVMGTGFDYRQVGDRLWPVLRQLMKGHTFVYRATHGLVGHRIPGAPPTLLLHHVGAKSGKARTTPLTYMRDGANLVLVASKGGYPKNPSWYHNLRANPDTTVQVGSQQRAVRARVATPAERTRLWPRVVELYGGYRDYQERTEREIPLVILEPAVVAGTRGGQAA